MVWSRPGRDWYAGRDPAPAAAAPASRLLSEPDQPPKPWQPPPQPGGQPGPPPPPPYQQQYPPPYQQPYQQQYDPYSPPYPPAGDSGKRPVTVTIACALTWLGSGLVLAMSLLLNRLSGSGRMDSQQAGL